MANRTVKDAHTIKGTNPQYLVEKIIRSRIYESKYWKEECFALSAELLVDKAMQLKFIGGVFSGNIKPTPFLCLVLKMLQIQPEKDIVLEFIRQQDFKYVRALGATYMRLTGSSLDCFKFLEPLYLDYRKMRRQKRDGEFELLHLDEFIDELLHEERVCDCILPRIQKRQVLEENNELEPRTSGLDDDLEEVEEEEEEEADEEDGEFRDREGGAVPDKHGPREWDRPQRSPSPKFRRSRSRSPHRRRGGSRERDRERDRGRDYGRERDRERDVERERHRRDRSRERHRRRSRSRERKTHKPSSHRHEADDRHHKHKTSSNSNDKSRSGGGAGGSSKKELEIEEANKLRASLGMKPLRP